MPENDWNEWSTHVLSELKRLNNSYEKLESKMGILHDDVLVLKIKAGVWGLLGGMIPVLITLVFFLLRKL